MVADVRPVPRSRPERSPRTVKMEFKVTDSEKTTIEIAARTKGVPVAQYMRDVVLWQSRTIKGSLF